VFCNFPTNPIRLEFLGIILKFQKFIQGLKILKINHWLTFTQQAKNNYKLNKFSLNPHYLTIILEDNGCKKLNIRDLNPTSLKMGFAHGIFIAQIF
jgi:hypothetical protein